MGSTQRVLGATIWQIEGGAWPHGRPRTPRICPAEVAEFVRAFPIGTEAGDVDPCPVGRALDVYSGQSESKLR